MEVSDYVVLLLSLYGVRTLKDLRDFDDDDRDEIVRSVRSGSMCGVEFRLKNVKLKYLGGEYSNVEMFDFKALDKKKLSRMKESAEQALELEKLAKHKCDQLEGTRKRSRTTIHSSTQSSTQSMAGSSINLSESSSEATSSVVISSDQTQRKEVHEEVFVDVSGDDETEEETEFKRDIEEEIRTLKVRILAKANEILTMSPFTVRCTEDDVTATHDGNRKQEFMASVKCPLCKKPYTLSFTLRTTATIANFKRHFIREHVERKLKVEVNLDKKQPKIDAAFKKSKSSAQSTLTDGDSFDLTGESGADANDVEKESSMEYSKNFDTCE